jgi:hypothetical protein
MGSVHLASKWTEEYHVSLTIQKRGPRWLLELSLLLHIHDICIQFLLHYTVACYLARLQNCIYPRPKLLTHKDKCSKWVAWFNKEFGTHPESMAAAIATVSMFLLLHEIWWTQTCFVPNHKWRSARKTFCFSNINYISIYVKQSN